MTNLGRLYAYAKGTTDAKEDFTREALAICIRHDPAPFIEALRDTGLIPPDVAPSPVMPFTQLSVPGVGRIDLVVRFGHGSGLEEWWFEAKVDAGESGDQLDRYRAHVASLPSAGRPSLISLARRPIRDDGSPFLPWRAVHAAARRSDHPHWRDLADWLEDLHMADAHDDSITLADLQSLSQAVSLYEKLCRVLSVVVTAGATRYATLAWPAPGDVRSAVEGELSFRGRFMLRVPTTNGRSHARLYLGAYTIDGPGLAIWVESDPRAGSQRRQIIDLANQQGLPAHWERQLASWQALLATPDLSDELTQEELVAWYLERIEELDRVGILRLMPTLTR